MSTTPDLHLLVAGYALDALDPAERVAFSTHLPDCPSCQEELSGMSETAALLADGEQLAPPPGMRAAVLATISATPQLPPVPHENDLAPVVPLAPRRASRSTWVLGVAAAVLAVAAVGLGARNVTLSHDLQQVQAASSDVSSVLTAPDAKTVTGQAAGGGNAAVVSSASLDRAVVVADNMPAAPAGHVYQLWLISADGKATSAGFMDPGANGQAAQALSGSVNEAAVVGVTVEPSGGSAQPTTKPVLAVQV